MPRPIHAACRVRRGDVAALAAVITADQVLPGRLVTDGDAEMIAAIALGDELAFGSFYDRYAPALARFAWTLSPDLDSASDIVQETFTTAWRKHSKIHLVADSALPWLLTTCRNHARNHARAERRWRRLVELQQDELRDAADESESGSDDLRWALESIADLPDLDRQVCELCLLHGLTYREAADRLGISESAAGKRLQRARTKLRKEATS